MSSRKVDNNLLEPYFPKVTTITEDGHPVDIQHVILSDSTGAAITTLDTELPTATLLADGDAIPTAPKVGAVMMAKNASGTLNIAKLAKAHDVDSGAGAEYATGISLRKPGNGASTDWMDDVDSRFLSAVTALEAILSVLQTDGIYFPASVPVTGPLTNAQYTSTTVRPADNGAFTDGTTRVQPAGYIFDETAGTALTENDVGASRMDSKRAQVITLEDATTRGRRQTVTTNGGAYVEQPTAANFNAQVVGNVASGATNSGNPLCIGGLAKTVNPTAVTDGQRVNALFDKLGKRVCVPSIRELKTKNFITLTSTTTETTLLSAGGAGVFLDITSITFTNTSATVTEVELREATGGSAVHSFMVPPTDSRGITVTDPIIQTTANNNWTAKCITSVASLKIQVNANKNI